MTIYSALCFTPCFYKYERLLQINWSNAALTCLPGKLQRRMKSLSFEFWFHCIFVSLFEHLRFLFNQNRLKSKKYKKVCRKTKCGRAETEKVIVQLALCSIDSIFCAKSWVFSVQLALCSIDSIFCAKSWVFSVQQQNVFLCKIQFLFCAETWTYSVQNYTKKLCRIEFFFCAETLFDFVQDWVFFLCRATQKKCAGLSFFSVQDSVFILCRNLNLFCAELQRKSVQVSLLKLCRIRYSRSAACTVHHFPPWSNSCFGLLFNLS